VKYNDVEKGQLEMRRQEFMTDEEIKEVDEYICELLQNRGEMEDLYDRWSDEDEIYRGDQPLKDGIPNTRVNIINAIIESQVSNLVDKNIAVTCRGEGVSDQGYANWARIGLDWTLRKNRIKKILAVHERRRSLFGNGFLRVHFNPDAFHGFGLVEITTPPLNKIYVDTKIKDPLRFQEADYIMETISMSSQRFEDMYGEDKASLIYYGSKAYEDTSTFNEEETEDDEDSATLILRWSRHKGKLRLQEFSGCGVLLFDSHKSGNRTDNQKNNKYNNESYYDFVSEKYPYFFTPMYPEEGLLWGFGEGKLLKPLQNMLNDLYDKIRMAARPNLLLVDYNSDIDIEDFDENSFAPRPANLQAGRAVETVAWGTKNVYWFPLQKCS